MVKGLGYQISYTWAHAMADFVDNLTGGSTPQNAYDYAHERSNSPFDQRHRFVASGAWRLPFGKDGWVMNNDSKTARFLGNWQFNGISDVADRTASERHRGRQQSDRWQSRGICELRQQSLRKYNHQPFRDFNAERSPVFTSIPTHFRLLRPARSAVADRGCSTVRAAENVDLSLFKQFPLGEVRKIELRFEFFNAFNHANFANPAASMTNTTTFGKVSATVNDPRQIQMAAKFYF